MNYFKSLVAKRSDLRSINHDLAFACSQEEAMEFERAKDTSAKRRCFKVGDTVEVAGQLGEWTISEVSPARVFKLESDARTVYATSPDELTLREPVNPKRPENFFMRLCAVRDQIEDLENYKDTLESELRAMEFERSKNPAAKKRSFKVGDQVSLSLYTFLNDPNTVGAITNISPTRVFTVTYDDGRKMMVTDPDDMILVGLAA